MTDKPEIELHLVADLVPYERNVKMHPPEHIKRLIASIKKFGWTNPIIIDKNGVIIAGHGRRLAAMELGLVKVPVIVRRDLSDAECRMMRLADNETSWNETDENARAKEVTDLMELLSADDRLEFGEMTGETDIKMDEESALDVMMSEDDHEQVIDDFTEGGKEATKTASNTGSPLSDAFGFGRVTVDQSREIKSIMSRIRHDAGLGKDASDAEKAEAFMGHIRASFDG